MDFVIVKIEYFENTKVVKKLVTEHHVKCNNCQTEMLYVNDSNVADSFIVDYDIIEEEFGYYPSGNKKYFTVLYKKNDVKHAIFWWENGIIESVGDYYYCDNNVADTTSYPLTSKTIGFVKNGIWIYYSESGKIERTETYDNGNLISTQQNEQ